MNNSNENKQNTVDSIKTYFKGIKSEWGKITWPQKPQIITETIIVLIVVFIITALVYLIDIGFQGIFHLLNLK